jgi:hypothetical protein
MPTRPFPLALQLAVAALGVALFIKYATPIIRETPPTTSTAELVPAVPIDEDAPCVPINLEEIEKVVESVTDVGSHSNKEHDHKMERDIVGFLAKSPPDTESAKGKFRNMDNPNRRLLWEMVVMSLYWGPGSRILAQEWEDKCHNGLAYPLQTPHAVLKKARSVLKKSCRFEFEATGCPPPDPD